VVGKVSEEKFDLVFQALSHKARRAVIKALGEKGSMTFTEMMSAAGIEETGTFGFHLKRLEPLLEKTEMGKYRLSELGRLAYKLLSFAGKAELEEESKARTISGLPTYLIDRETLEKAPIYVRDCDEVIVARDVDPELVREKLIGMRNITVVKVPKELYEHVIKKLEGNIGSIVAYEGQAPPKSLGRAIENYSVLSINCDDLVEGTSIRNYGKLKLLNLTEENISRLARIENYGLLLVPKGFKMRVLGVVSNYGKIGEYEE